MTYKKSFILFIAGIILLFGSTYFMHLNKFSDTKKVLKEREIENANSFNKLKEELKAQYVRENENESYIFDEIFDIEKAISFKDSTVSFFLYSDQVEVKLIDKNYLKCVQLKAKSLAVNKRSDNEYNQKLDELTIKYGPTAKTLASFVGKDMFLIHSKENNCKPYFSDNNSYIIDPLSFQEYSRFLVEYRINEQKMSLKNEIIARSYENEILNLKRGLNGDAMRVFNQNLQFEKALKSENEYFAFKWAGRKDFAYPIIRKEIDHNYIDNTMNEVYAEQYKDYSLKTGSMPYSYCFGNSNSGQSGVRVKAGGGDVLVTIKNMNDQVIRHAYIEARNSYTLSVPNGNYYVYFYYGTGWNPKRFMKDTSCGRLVGGFLSNESVSKDPNVLKLYSGIMTYTLTEQINGNFSTAGSSKNEAF
jgi:hypothetical protein